MSDWPFTPVYDEVLASLPEAARRYLTEVGLPTSIEIWMAAIRKISFTPLQAIRLNHVDYLQIGIAGYTAVFKHLPLNPLVLENASGAVYLLNGIEMAAGHEARWFFNSTVEQLMQSLMTYEENLPRIQAHNRYCAEREQSLRGLHDARLAEVIKELRQHGQQTYDEIRPQIERIDPAAFATGEQPLRVWPDTLLEIRWSSPTP